MPFHLTWTAIHTDLRSKMFPLTISVAEIKEGDECVRDGKGWVAIEDAETSRSTGEVVVRVRHEPDGGIADRFWDDATHRLTVRRAV